MFKKLVCLMIVMALASTAQALVFSDDFDHQMDAGWGVINYQGWYEQTVLMWPSPGGIYSGNGVPWSIGGWDGYQSVPDAMLGISPTIMAQNVIDTFNYADNKWSGEPVQPWYPGYEGEVFNGVLRMSSTGSSFEHQLGTAPFLFKMVSESFVAEVEVVAADNFWHNMGGLMARVPNDMIVTTDGKLSAMSNTGASEDWTQVSYFPLYGVGNRANDTDDGTTSWLGIKGYPPDQYMRLTGHYIPGYAWRFFYETRYHLQGPWVELPGLEGGILRTDMADVSELQVGIFQNNFTGDWIGNMDFDNFSIDVPEPATIALLGLGGLALIRRKRA